MLQFQHESTNIPPQKIADIVLAGDNVEFIIQRLLANPALAKEISLWCKQGKITTSNEILSSNLLILWDIYNSQSLNEIARVIRLTVSLESPNIVRPLAIYCHFNRASAYEDLYDDVKAIEDYNEIINLISATDPLFLLLKAYKRQADIYLSNKQFNSALLNYIQIVHLEPTVENLIQRGHCYLVLDESFLAVEDFKAALLKGPANQYLQRQIETYNSYIAETTTELVANNDFNSATSSPDQRTSPYYFWVNPNNTSQIFYGTRWNNKGLSDYQKKYDEERPNKRARHH